MIRLKNEDGLLKECKIGFSWTLFFFGIFVPIIRGDYKKALIMGLVGLLTAGLSWWVFPFFYNKMYVRGLVEKGYEPVSEIDRNILIEKGIIIGE